MSTLKANNIQIGQSATATQNFVLAVPTTPDGTVKLARGNQGATTQDILSVDSSGKIALTFSSYTETVYTLGTSGSIALNPANGTVQTCAAAGTVTFTDSLSSGQTVALRLTNGASYTINWPTMTWVTSAGNSAPTLTANDTLVFWKISTTLYGAYVGSGA